MNRLLYIGGIGLALTLAACDTPPPSSAQKTRAAAELNQDALLTASPVPKLTNSEELANLDKRATRLNQLNMTGCVSIFTPSGVMLYQGVVDGKVSSLKSYRLPGDRVENVRGTAGSWLTSLTIEAPDIDGAYGENADGVFFFNADSDAYIEAGGVTYIYTDQCLQTSQEPILVQAVPPQAPAAPAPSAAAPSKGVAAAN